MIDADFMVQHIVHWDSQEITHQEVLSRPKNMGGAPSLEVFFENMAPATQIEWLKLQLDDVVSRENATNSLNLSATALRAEEHREAVFDLLAGHREPVVLEITEGHPMPTPAIANAFFQRLRKLGHRLALDDFGAGESQKMSLIAEYDFDIIKIDRGVSARFEDTKVRQHLRVIRSFVSLMNKQCVVEGIESNDQLNTLRDLGFTTFQGYFLHRPEQAKRLSGAA